MNKAKHSFAVLVLAFLCFCTSQNDELLSVSSAFRAVLLNEATVFCTDSDGAREFEGLKLATS